MAKPNDFTEIPIVDHKPRLSPYSAKNCFTSFLDKSFSISHVNVRSFNKKMPQLEILLTQLQINFSCIIVSETWFSENQFLNSYYLDDYNLYCRSRIDGGGGGVCVYVLKELETRVVDVRLMGSFPCWFVCLTWAVLCARCWLCIGPLLVVGGASLRALGPWRLHFHQTL